MESDSDFLAPLFLHSKEITQPQYLLFHPGSQLGSHFPYQGWNPNPLQWKPGVLPMGWMARESPRALGLRVTCLIGLSLLPAFLGLPGGQSFLQ